MILKSVIMCKYNYEDIKKGQVPSNLKHEINPVLFFVIV